jgi:hypothetical protein
LKTEYLSCRLAFLYENRFGGVLGRKENKMFAISSAGGAIHEEAVLSRLCLVTPPVPQVVIPSSLLVLVDYGERVE